MAYPLVRLINQTEKHAPDYLTGVNVDGEVIIDGLSRGQFVAIGAPSYIWTEKEAQFGESPEIDNYLFFVIDSTRKSSRGIEAIAANSFMMLGNPIYSERDAKFFQYLQFYYHPSANQLRE